MKTSEQPVKHVSMISNAFKLAHPGACFSFCVKSKRILFNSAILPIIQLHLALTKAVEAVKKVNAPQKCEVAYGALIKYLLNILKKMPMIPGSNTW